MPKPHIFANNPLNRGEVERRYEGWIARQAHDAGRWFPPFRQPEGHQTNLV